MFSNRINHNEWVLTWHESWDHNNLIKNKSKINYEAELSTNSMLNDEIKKINKKNDLSQPKLTCITP